MPIWIVSSSGSGVRMPPLRGLLTGFLAPGHGEMDQPLTLGKCYIPRYVPGNGVSIDWCIIEQWTSYALVKVNPDPPHPGI